MEDAIMEGGVIYQIDRETLKSVMKEVFKEIQYEKFYDAQLSARAVAEIHNVSVPTISRYTKMGLLEPSVVKPIIRYRGSDVLKLDFKELKYKVRSQSAYNLNK